MAQGNGIALLNGRMIANGIIKALEPYCEKIEVAGSIRRKSPFINDIDIVLIPKTSCINKIKNTCMSWHPGGNDIFKPVGQQEHLLKWGNHMATFSYKGKVHVDLYFATDKTFTILYMIRTGSKEHNIWLCSAAKTQGKYIAADGSGIYLDRNGKIPIPVQTEGDIYGVLDLPYLEPVDRDGEFNEYPVSRC